MTGADVTGADVTRADVTRADVTGADVTGAATGADATGAAAAEVGSGPLSGVRVLAIEQYGAGPFGTSHLADLGAEVIKIEDAADGGDVGRHVPPYTEGDDSLFFETFNRGKRSICLDLSVPAGRTVFEDLVKASDAVFSNLRGDVPAKIGITYDTLKHLNPRVVCCSLSGFGNTGPRRAEPGYDYVMQGLAGWMDLTGEPLGPPTKSGLSVVDYTGGFVAAFALVAALFAASRTGVGCDCDVSLFDTAISMLTYPAVWHLNAGYTPTRMSSSAHPSLVPFQAFPAADGWLVIACPKQKFWIRLTAALDLPELAHDARYLTFADRLAHRAELVDALSRRLAERSVATWIDILQRAAVPCAPVNTVAQALTDPQVAARELLLEAEHPRFGTVRTIASPVRVGNHRSPTRPAPQLGADTSSVLTDVLGYGPARIGDVAEGGAFGPSLRVHR